MRKEFNDIRSRINKCSSLDNNAIDTVLDIVSNVEEEYFKRSINHTLLNSTVKDLVFAKKSVPSPLALHSIDRAIKLLKNVEDFTWCPIEMGCSLPDEGVEVEVTIMEDHPENSFMKVVRVSTSWLQDGEWVIRKSPLNPKVVAWKYTCRPYVPDTLIVTQPFTQNRGE